VLKDALHAPKTATRDDELLSPVRDLGWIVQWRGQAHCALLRGEARCQEGEHGERQECAFHPFDLEVLAKRPFFWGAFNQ
jgi:hypothetical protein